MTVIWKAQVKCTWPMVPGQAFWFGKARHWVPCTLHPCNLPYGWTNPSAKLHMVCIWSSTGKAGFFTMPEAKNWALARNILKYHCIHMPETATEKNALLRFQAKWGLLGWGFLTRPECQVGGGRSYQEMSSVWLEARQAQIFLGHCLSRWRVLLHWPCHQHHHLPPSPRSQETNLVNWTHGKSRHWFCHALAVVRASAH